MVEASVQAETTGTASGDGPLVAAARGVERTIGIAKESVSQAKEKVSESASRAKEGMKEIPGKTVGELADSVTQYAKDHPGQTILVSLGVGALLGMLLSRR